MIVFYRPLKYKDKETGKEIDLNEKYDAFHPYDPINYFEFIFFGIFLFPIRGIICFLICICLNLNLKYLKYKYKNIDTDPSQNEIHSKVIKFWSYLFLYINNISLEKEELNYEPIYKKYLGNDYNFKEEKYSLLICNHIGFYDVIANMALNGCGFLAMKIISYIPIGSGISNDIGSVFVERQSEKSRKESFEQIYERQINFYKGKNLNKILVFPEGTTSNNRYIVKFKQGVFKALLPLKPIIMHIDKNEPFHLSSNVQNLFYHVMRSFTCWKNKIYYNKLPIIKPTQYMFDNYKNYGKEKWEIYSKIVKNIYIEVGKFKNSELGHRDKDIYYDALETGIYNGEILSKK